MFIEALPEVPAHLPTFSLDTFQHSRSQAKELWRSVVDGTFELEGRTEGEGAHRVKTQVWFLEELVLAKFEGEANIVHRTKALSKSNPTQMVKVRVYLSGHSVLIDGDTETKIGAGAIHFIDHDRPLRQISTDHDQYTLSVPYHAIGYSPDLHPACLSISFDTPRGRLIHAGLSTLLTDISSVTLAEAPALSEAVSGLLRGALAGGLESQDDRGIRLVRINTLRRYIDQNLSDPDLGLESLLCEFGASRATIYRDFADVGGLQHYILERRLQRAYRLLAEALPLRGQVQVVASRCGFASLAHFSRRFRAAYGVAPSDLLGQWSQGDKRQIGTDHDRPAEVSDTPVIAALNWAYSRFR